MSFVGGCGPVSESGGRTIVCCGGQGGCPQELHLISNLLKLLVICIMYVMLCHPHFMYIDIKREKVF